MKRPDLGDSWFESEEPTSIGFVSELQRIRRRTWVRPIPVLLLAALITAAVTYKLATRPRIYEADVVLALDEGTATTSKRNIPFESLRGYVMQVLLPDAKLLALIEKRNLHRLRRVYGPQYALSEMRDQIEVVIWKNSFLYYADQDDYAAKSARIGITILDGDPDLAFDIAHDVASIVIESHEEQRREVADALTREVQLMHQTTSQRAAVVSNLIAVKETAIAAARKDKNHGLSAALEVDLTSLEAEKKHLDAQLSLIATSPEAFADQVTRAGLDTTISVVEERRPERQEQSGFVLVLVIVVVGTGTLIGAAVVLGAFDSRVHDTDDVERLGLPVLGHVPGFPGDHVGSLEARGAVRARVPSFRRWRSHR